MESLAATILDATYNKVDLDKGINNQKHLNKKKGTEESPYQIRKTIPKNTWSVSTKEGSHRTVSRRSR